MIKNIKALERGWCTILEGQLGIYTVPLAMLYQNDGPGAHRKVWATKDATPTGQAAIDEFYGRYVQLNLADDIEYMSTKELLEYCEDELSGPTFLTCS